MGAFESNVSLNPSTGKYERNSGGSRTASEALSTSSKKSSSSGSNDAFKRLDEIREQNRKIDAILAKENPTAGDVVELQRLSGARTVQEAAASVVINERQDKTTAGDILGMNKEIEQVQKERKVQQQLELGNLARSRAVREAEDPTQTFSQKLGSKFIQGARVGTLGETQDSPVFGISEKSNIKQGFLDIAGLAGSGVGLFVTSRSGAVTTAAGRAETAAKASTLARNTAQGLRIAPQVEKAAFTARGAVQAVKATKPLQLAAQGVQRAEQISIGGKNVGKPIIGGITTFSKAAAASLGVQTGLTQGLNVATLSKEERKFLKENKAQIEQAQAFQTEELNKKGFFKSAAGSLPFLDTPLSNNAFAKGLSAQGFTEEQIALANKQKRNREAGFVGGLLTISTASELIGQRNVAQAFGASSNEILNTGKIGKEAFKKTFFPIARAGFIEGSVSSLNADLARPQGKKVKDIAKQSLTFGAFGFGSAGLIGGGIAGLEARAAAQKGSKSAAKVALGAAYISDPFEFPGDFAANKLVNPARRRFSKSIILEPAISLSSPTKAETFSFTTEKTGGKNTPLPTFRNLRAGNVKDFIFNIGGKSPVPTDTTPTGANTPTDITPDTPTNTDTATNTINNIIGTPTNTNTNINTNINTPTNINTNIKLPTNIPIFRIPPPVPLTFPFGSGSASAGIGRRKTFVNELNEGSKVLNDLLGVKQPKKTNLKKVKNKLDKMTKKNTNEFTFNNIAVNQAIFGNQKLPVFKKSKGRK